MLIQYHLDEHIDPAIAIALRKRGIDVTTTSNVQLEQASDSTQLEWASRNGRVIVTRDQDYLILNANGVEHAGIVFWHSKRQGLGIIIKNLTLLWRTTTAAEMQGVIQFF